MAEEVSFVYPPGGNFSVVSPSGNVNIYDTLEVTYESTWDRLNLTVFCLVGSTATDSWFFFNVEGNPILPSGTYRIDSINDLNFDIFQYPTKCSVKLTQYGDNENALGGEEFTVVSEEGTSTTFKQSATVSDTTYTLQTETATATSGSEANLPSLSTPSPPPPPTPTPADPSPPFSSSTSQGSSDGISTDTTSAGLSTGAKAGIGVGVAALVLIIAACAFIFFRRRRRTTQPAAPQYDGKDVSELSTEHGIQEKDSTAISVVGHQTGPVELPTVVNRAPSTPPSELDSSNGAR